MPRIPLDIAEEFALGGGQSVRGGYTPTASQLACRGGIATGGPSRGIGIVFNRDINLRYEFPKKMP
jgi:hypothetical protein